MWGTVPQGTLAFNSTLFASRSRGKSKRLRDTFPSWGTGIRQASGDQNRLMSFVNKRIVLHFPGFEPLDAEAHRQRYERAARQSARTWNFSIRTGALENPRTAPSFAVEAEGEGWETGSRIHVLDHNDLICGLRGRSLIRRIAGGYLNGARVVFHGGASGYFRHAWRFGLFFLFPFLLMAVGIAGCGLIAALPVFAGLGAWHLLWSLPVSLAVFVKVFLPLAERLHTVHLFDDWGLAVSLARLEGPGVEERLAACVAQARAAFAEEADEYLVTSHSMGASMAVHVIGRLLEEDPRFFSGKRVVFATLGSGLLQCALLRPATVLRHRIGLIARCREIFWLDVHCLTDAINFYKVRAVAAAGHADAPQAHILTIRFKAMLAPERYRRIRRQLLRVHRQYVLGSERRSTFDFTLMTAGPLWADAFSAFLAERLPPISMAEGDARRA